MKILFAFFLSFCATATSAKTFDVVTFLNGRIYEGQIVKLKECQVFFLVANETYTIPADSIFSIEFGDKESKIYHTYLKREETDKCLAGKYDARHHRKLVGPYFVGFLFGPFGVIGTAIGNPTPEKGKNTSQLSTNKESFNDPEYIKCYKKKVKKQRVNAALTGWCAAILIVLTITTTQ